MTLPFKSVFVTFSLPVAVPFCPKTVRACRRRCGLMVSTLTFGSSGQGSSPGRGHCVVFLGKTLTVPLHPGV